MKLSVILPLSLAFVFLIIGLYEMMALGPESGYWSIMLAIALFFWYLLRKNSPNKQ
ncbi:MAG: hypothetical protein ACO263_03545 [Cyclobacteriaceae bacterium]|jgi:hypothetical protein